MILLNFFFVIVNVPVIPSKVWLDCAAVPCCIR